ncbi:MAG: T9SS type A sorting domain-containing protein [Bacteroidales bacterium]|nr:T9SS type A sorting domain-containing protein [Bacteroidales bacterium]MCF8386604.1 T9SS type A sorting domain-containing protein [Bacteroidales bacterium]
MQVISLGIDNGDADEEVLQYEETFGALYPSISGVEGGGTAICSDYQIPAKDLININLEKPEMIEIQVAIFDVLGRKHMSARGFSINDEMQLDVSGLPAGNYWLNVVTEGSRHYTEPIMISD